MYFRGHSFFTLVIINSDIFITECCNPFLVSLAFDLRNNFIHMRQIKDGITVSFKSSFHNWVGSETYGHRGGSRTAARSKMERFVITVNGFQPLTLITKTLHIGCCSSPRSASESSWSTISIIAKSCRCVLLCHKLNFFAWSKRSKNRSS